MDENVNSNNPFENNDEENIEETKKEQDDSEVSEENDKETNAQDENDKETSEETSEINDELQNKYDELNNKYIRLAADFDNFRKRTQAEKEELSQYTIVATLRKLTGVLDTFDRAQEHLKDIEECQTVKEGYEVAYKQLTDTLKKIGLEEIDCLGKPFNPNEHEAVTQIPTDEYEPDCVAVVMQKGYKLDKRI